VRPQQDPPKSAREETPGSGAIRSDLAGLLEVTMPSAAGAPAAARAAVTAWVSGRVSELVLADAQLLVVELVTNSVRHARAPDDAVITVRIRVCADVVRVEVEDDGRTEPIARRAPDMQDGGGFGLNLVEGLSVRWGVDRTAGTRVWADIAVAPAAEIA
jgi:serine/threonine-protein kinase RsbW